MTLTQALGYGLLAMAVVALIAIGYGFKLSQDFSSLQHKLDLMDTEEYRDHVCAEVLKTRRKLKGFS